MDPKIPAQLARNCRGREERERWLSSLPAAVRELQQRWELQLGNPFEGAEVSCSWVAPARRNDGGEAILKLGMPHMEGEGEIAGLRFWAGDPTVRLLEADDALGAMLLERCLPGIPLRALPEEDQDTILAGLLRRLWRRPAKPDLFRPLGAMAELWIREALGNEAQWRDAGLIREGVVLFRQLAEPTSFDVLLATDLHAGNVLRAEREPWLVIDPKPFLGDRAYDATQHLLNCYQRVLADPGGTISRFAALLELDYERVRLWMFARTALQAADEWQDNRTLELARSIGTP